MESYALDASIGKYVVHGVMSDSPGSLPSFALLPGRQNTAEPHVILC